MTLDGAGKPQRTVLIVDDDEEIRHVLRLMCEMEGFEVIGEAANGVEAVSMALHHQPGFVILDYLMPRLNGDEAARMLRAIAPETKIVAFSAILPLMTVVNYSVQDIISPERRVSRPRTTVLPSPPKRWPA